MAIEKGKMGLLIAALKPGKVTNSSKPKKEEDESEDPNREQVAADLADAIVGGDRDAIKEALLAFHDCVTGEDKKQDEEEEAGPEEEKDEED